MTLRKRAAIVVSLLVAACEYAFALNPSLDIHQYARTSWKVRDGFVNGPISAIAQTLDGYLWLGTDSGLFRFDGIKAVQWQASIGTPVNRAMVLHAAGDGALWIATYPGVATLRGSAFTTYPEMAGKFVTSFAEDRGGRVWMATAAPERQLCIGERTELRCLGPDARFGSFIGALLFDSTDTLWAGLLAGVARVSTDGTPEVYTLPPLQDGYRALVADGPGQLLVAQPSGLTRFVDGHLTLARPTPRSIQPFIGQALLRDRDGALWLATRRGIVHFHDGRAARFTQADGLSGDYVNTVFEDREGSIWIATREGLDRFRDLRIPTYSVRQGLSNAAVTSVLAARDGAIWIGSSDGLTRWDRGRVTIFRERHQPTDEGIREVAARGFPDGGVHALLQDRQDRIWISDRRSAGVVVGDRFVPVLQATGGDVPSIVEDRRGDIWIATRRGLAHIRGKQVLDVTAWRAISGHGLATVMIADPRNDALWLGFGDGTVGYLASDRLETVHESSDPNTLVARFRVDSSGAVWASTEAGLRRFKNGRSVRLGSDTGLPCTAVQWSLEDTSGHVWLAMPCGLVRVAGRDLDARADAIERGDAATVALETTLFDEGDGYLRRSRATGYNPQATFAPDGRIWFATSEGVSVIDPRNLDVKGLAPPVHVEGVIADRRRYDATTGVQLPPRIRDLQIDYTALSLVAPEKNQFRVRLDGRDTDWQHVGTRRQAFYTDLGPGSYRFRVIASNNSGVWNETGAALEFSIAPAYYQTRWFAALVVVGTMTLLWTAYQLRIRQVARQFNRTLDARVSERTRIARELHDTLLQSFHGSLLLFQTALNQLPDRPAEPKERLARAIDQAAKAITEGRDAVQGLRTSTIEKNNLALAISALGAELAGDGSGVQPAFHVAVEGETRELHPILRDEIYKIAAEALRNAFRHANAGRVEVEIRYDTEQFRLRVRDDGKGIDSKVLATHGPEGHYGLRGMPERAALIGGKLAVWSEVGAGTEVELRLAARIAYATSPRRRWWSRLLAAKTPAQSEEDAL